MDESKLSSISFDFMKKGKKEITLDEIRQQFQLVSYRDTVQVVTYCLDHNLIVPCGKKKTIEIPNLPLKYKRVMKEDKTKDYSEEIKYCLHPKINKTYLLKDFNYYEENREDIMKISQYLSMPSLYDLAINERSLLLFNHEKKLNKYKDTLLKRIGITLKDLNVYLTPEPFFYYTDPISNSNIILIVENKDTWYTMKRMMQDGLSVLGYSIKTVIYGEGRKIESSLESIYSIECKHLLNETTRVLYFGDIDAEGISILTNLQERYKNLKIEPFYAGYHVLLNHLEYVRDKDDVTSKIDIDKLNIPIVLNELDSSELAIIQSLLRKYQILPQEILNNERLRTYDR